ncbi:tumor necrosis factor receptor superfamily member 4-like [Orbicella faveolata]|uniref:tumor necrosis factor receptor superfamily member 4-like n=1 Tax=Orbicella faveolata TaxID=48498 RepID=UPI0009E3860D|nr:tumor necrosis factor receptor superfamily member 4-like [Orbicella faveolata]
MMVLACFLGLTIIIRVTLAAVDDCPQLQFWNGAFCVSCSPCPPGYGVETKCSQKSDTECQACQPGFDYSDTSGFESCFGCDEFSNCPLVNAKEVRKCTVYSKRVCDGCLDGYFYNPGTGGCQECSSPCGFHQDETRPCTTNHDRTCSPKTTESTILATNSTLKVSKSIFRPSTKPRTPRNQIDADSPSPQETTTVENHWLWIGIGVVVALVVAMIILMICRYRRNKRNQKGQGNRGANVGTDWEERRDTQESIPLMLGLDLPIKDLKIDGKTFIAQRLNGKDNYGYCYCRSTGERLGFDSAECSAWQTAENPTEKLLKAYGEKAGSTVRNLIKALRDPEVGLTQFANEIEAKFSGSTTQHQNEGESNEEIESTV